MSFILLIGLVFLFVLKNYVKILFRLPKLIVFKIYDIYDYFKYKRWNEFQGYGLHLYCGLFGTGKTLSLVRKARQIANRYDYVQIYSNIQLFDFPNPSRIHKLENYQQIISAPPNSVFVIDEISTLFNSRKWADFPFILLSQLLQVRKNRKMILATAQRFNHVDKLIRDVTTTVTVCSCYFKRLCINRVFDAYDYENSTLYLPKVLDFVVYVASNKLRNSYDTYEIISNDVKSQFLSNKEVLELRGDSPIISVSPDSSKKKNFFFRKK